MSGPVVVPPRGGEVVGDAPHRRVEILSATPGLHATWSRYGPRTRGAELHVHRCHTDLFYVLTGELTLMVGVERTDVAVPAGTLARLPAMVPHGFHNPSDADVTYLNLHAPGRGFAEFLRTGDISVYDQEPPPAGGLRPAGDAAIGGAADEPDIGVAEVHGEAPRVPGDHLAAYFALDGDLLIRLDEREIPAVPGSWVTVPAGTEHTASAGRLLAIHAPEPPG